MEASELHKPIRYVKGVGEKLSLLLAKKSIFNIEDALYFFPRHYEDRRKISKVSELKIGAKQCVIGRVRRAYPFRYTRSRRAGFELILEDLEDSFKSIKLRWFHQPHIAKKLDAGTLLFVTGDVQVFRSQLQMVHPDVEVLGKNLDPETKTAGIIPIYSQTDGLYQKTLRKIEKQVVGHYSRFLAESLPEFILKKYDFPVLKDAIRSLHFPDSKSDFEELLSGESPAHQRMIYEEFFFFSLALAISRKNIVQEAGQAFEKPSKLWKLFADNLGFKFTNAQRRVLGEILEDMCSPRVMYRMIQGDVGSGKTAVGAASALVALESGFQVAFMAPTEVLVEQHFEKFKTWFEGMGIQCLQYTGSMPKAEKEAVLRYLSSQENTICFGTHALFEDKVKFKKLGLVIVDEQHRFGVRQRARLIQKGAQPDVLVMTATPIPRTLALTIYGDLDVSVIDELPPGRKEIKTKLFTEKQRQQFYQSVVGQLKKGRQVYTVYPLIEDSEKLALKSIENSLPEIREAYQGFEVGVLHGRMDSAEKLRILNEFREGKIHVLVSTTVIEVGVDVPNATVMVVENAERFGISQLHQLRGRVGRGSEQSFCYLVASHLGSPEILRRLKSMEKLSDGFKLSEIDLEMRGPGEFLGTKQSGLPEFRLAQLPRDLIWLQEARRDAFALIDRDPHLKEHPPLKRELEKRFRNFHLG